MKVSLFLIFAVVAISSAHRCFPVADVKQCKLPHQEYTSCYGDPDCQYNCEYPSGPYRCHKMCVAGCRCKKGYVEDENRNCIKIEECPATTPICRASEHKYYTQCNAHCPIKTCDNPDGAQICNLMCVEGCICEDGYLQDKDGNCIKPEECPQKPFDPASCFLPQVTGPCKGRFPRWGYDSETGCCTQFIYGGCEGNANRFDTEAECNSSCL